MKATKQRTPIGAIFLTVLIDMIGVGIVIPVIPTLFFDDVSGFFAGNFDRDNAALLYGLLLASFPFMQFIGAPILGALSDRYGRKPMLLLSITFTAIGYLLFGYAILGKHLGLLFFSRMLPGFMGGNISIIYSSMADISDAKSKAKNFGLVGAAFGIGFIIGPALGGILADPSVVSWFDYSTPFFVTTILCVFNLSLLYFIFPETLKQRRNTPVSAFTGFKNIALSFKYPEMRVVFIVTLLLSLGFAFFTQFFSVYLIEQFDYTQKDIGLLFGWIGIWLVLTQGGIVRRMSGRIAPAKVIRFSMAFLGLFLALLLFPKQSWWFYLINPFIAIAQGINNPNLTTLVSNLIGIDRQGEILGIQQSMRSLGNMVPPLIAGWLTMYNNTYPLVAAAVFTILAWIVFMFFFKEK